MEEIVQFAGDEVGKNVKGVRVIGFLMIFLVSIMTVGCDLFEGLFVTMPSELIGTWKQKSGQYVRQFEFTSSALYYEGWNTKYPVEGYSSYDCDLEEVLSDESMIYTSCDIYYVYHISGSTLYLEKTNAGDPKPDLEDQWWKNTELGFYTLEKIN
jgi:hypothetical protein